MIFEEGTMTDLFNNVKPTNNRSVLIVNMVIYPKLIKYAVNDIRINNLGNMVLFFSPLL